MTGSVQANMPSVIPGPRLIDGQDILDLVQATASGNGNLTALAGGGAPGAPVLQARINEFKTVATTNDSTLLPPAISGLTVVIINSGAQTLRVFPFQANPNNGNVVDVLVNLAGASVASVDIAANAMASFHCPLLGRWKASV